ncbi:MAG: SPOR domain-containing protein [Candidatus Krumholzibacteriota bacterium]|nr:SPOR domain-containing protein [Candidatus Krumholzibacteriota bacterium]
MSGMSDSERKHACGAGHDAVEGGYSIFIDGETIASFMEAGDFSSARELRHFEEIAAAVDGRSAAEAGVSLMAFSVTADRLARDFTVVNVAHVLAKRGKRVLVVDCDFLEPGLSGFVEKVEDLGFLDLLLYGSSLKTVMRPTGIDGVSVTGPGSFPVTRTVPFARKEFAKVRGHLARSSDVVIYCSTLYTEEGETNPLASLVDGLVLCCRIDEMEEGQLRRSIDDLDAGLPPAELVCFCARGGEAPAERTPAVAEPAAPDLVFTKVSDGETGHHGETAPGDETARDEEPGLDGEPFFDDEEEIGDEEERTGVNLPRVVTIAVVAIVAGFLAWWFFIERSVRRDEEPPVQATAGETVVPPFALNDASAGIDAAEEQAPEETGTTGDAGSPAGEPAEATTVDAENGGDGAARETPPAAAPAAAGLYTVHVSSFRDAARVTREIEYLKANGFDATTVEVDIRGERWIRVLVGSFETVEDANEAKLELLSLRRVADARVIRRPVE